MKAINSRFNVQIEDHIVIQKIIDSHFDEYTHITYSWLLFIYTFFFVFAFIYQMHSTDKLVVLWSNISCLIVTLLFVFLRVNLLVKGNFTGLKEYFTVFTIVNLFG
jgi:hypothetical protein